MGVWPGMTDEQLDYIEDSNALDILMWKYNK